MRGDTKCLTLSNQDSVPADLIEAGGGIWLLAPLTPELLDALVVVGTADEDAEPDDPVEDDNPFEPTYRYLPPVPILVNLAPPPRGAFSSHTQARRLDRGGSERDAVGAPDDWGYQSNLGRCLRAPLFFCALYARPTNRKQPTTES